MDIDSNYNTQLFIQIVMTFFIGSLQDFMPNQLIIIFDNFILKGVSLILKLILAIIEHQQKQILSLEDTDLLNYMKHEIYEDCLS